MGQPPDNQDKPTKLRARQRKGLLDLGSTSLILLVFEIKMPPVETSRVYMRRLSAKHRSLVLKRKQDDLNIKKKQRETEPRATLTPEQRAELRKRFKDRKACNEKAFAKAYKDITDIAEKASGEVGKSPKVCLRILMQLARIQQSARKTSLWNAYVAICFEEREDGQFRTSFPPGK